MFVLGYLPPYEHVCVCLSVHAYVPECIVCACKHASVRVCACARAWGRMCKFICPSYCQSVRVHVRASKCLIVHACVRVFACARAWGRMFVRTCVRLSMHARYFLFLASNFSLPCLYLSVWLRTNMCAYVYPSVRMCLSASCVRVRMLAFVCVHARVHEGVCVGLSARHSTRPSVCLCLSACLSACMFVVQMFVRRCVRSSMHAFVCLHARVREGVYLSSSVLPSVRPCICLSDCPRPCSCVQIFVRTCVRSSMHARHFLFLTCNFHVCTLVFVSVGTCVRMSIRPCVCT